MAMVLLLSVVTTVVLAVNGQDTSFVFHGFRSANLTKHGFASVTSNGLLQHTNKTKLHMGHAFFTSPFTFTDTSSFSTIFVFAIRPLCPSPSCIGIAFLISPAKAFPGARPSQYLGLCNETTNGDPSNHVFAVELRILPSMEFEDINHNHVRIKDINHNHVRIDVNGLSLASGSPMQVRVDYDGSRKQVSVTLAPINVNKPETPLLTLSKDLSHVVTNSSYVGFSSSSGPFLTSHYVLGWRFKLNGDAHNHDASQLPRLRRLGGRKRCMILPNIWLSLLSLCLVFLVSSCVGYYIYRRRKFSEVVEEWEQDYGPHRFKYKDLYIATKGFEDKELLGRGGFGKVYKGTIPGSRIDVAVKKISNESQQGVREFVAEIISIGRFRHRNLVPLSGYCRRKGELLLVYDFMPNGSLDKYLHHQPHVTLNWTHRFKIIKGVASGLHYLHEGCEKVVVHRDIKASNVLLDSELNGRLGDFGLAKLYDHGRERDPQTTRVVGTWGYLAPEQARTGRATTKSDVFAFGAFLLEVACGRRPIEQVNEEECAILVDWVYGLWNRGEIIEAKDPNLGTDYSTEEIELVLKLGLVCSSSQPVSRPSMHQVVQYLNREVPLPDLPSLRLSSFADQGLSFGNYGFLNSTSDESIPLYFNIHRSSSLRSVADSVLSGGR